jgi:hypothetical protein
MSTAPGDFPTSEPIATVPGAQQKFSCTQGADGRLTPSGGTRAERHARCAELATWATEFLKEKLAKPKHASLALGAALEKLRLTLRAEFPDLSVAEIAWILSRVEQHWSELHVLARGDIE